jgi:hypothetical protein
VTTSAGTPVHPHFRIIDELSIRIRRKRGRDDDALPLRIFDSGRLWVVTGLAAASAVGDAAAGASTGRDIT